MAPSYSLCPYMPQPSNDHIICLFPARGELFVFQVLKIAALFLILMDCHFMKSIGIWRPTFSYFKLIKVSTSKNIAESVLSVNLCNTHTQQSDFAQVNMLYCHCIFEKIRHLVNPSISTPTSLSIAKFA